MSGEEMRHRVADAMWDRARVWVRTETREFEGLVYEIGLSPFSGETRARVVDDEGRVHYFYVERADVLRVPPKQGLR